MAAGRLMVNRLPNNFSGDFAQQLQFRRRLPARQLKSSGRAIEQDRKVDFRAISPIPPRELCSPDDSGAGLVRHQNLAEHFRRNITDSSAVFERHATLKFLLKLPLPRPPAMDLCLNNNIDIASSRAICSASSSSPRLAARCSHIEFCNNSLA